MKALLIENPLLLLFVVAAIGYPIGRIRIGGVSLGVAAVLFVGLAFGSLDPDMKLPELIYQLGLILFVYTVGLSSGRLFFASLRRGLRDNILVVAVLVLAAGMTLAAHWLLNLKPALTAGMYAGSLTNTPALASLIEYLKQAVPAAAREQVLNEPVIAYSITYPVGVIGMIAAIVIAQRWFKINYALDAAKAEPGATSRLLENRTIRITKPAATSASVSSLTSQHRWEVVFGRMRHNGQLGLAGGDTVFALGDLVSVVGPAEDLDTLTEFFGETSAETLALDRSELDYRRMFVSNPKVVGHRLRDLNLPQQFGAVVTRLRRRDIEMLVTGDTIIELGDRVRVVARREHMDTIAKFFGDSYRALSEIDILTFNLGLALGLLVGMIPLPLPGGVTIKLGFAGGPLVMALILGALNRTGPLVWNLPYNANLTLRQTGLVLFLAGIGTRAGYSFVSTLTQGGGLQIFLAGAAITLVVALLTLFIGYRVLKLPMGVLIGLLAGLQTQPAVLGFALEQSGNELPNVGYARVFPIALIAKIILAQFILGLLM